MSARSILVVLTVLMVGASCSGTTDAPPEAAAVFDCANPIEVLDAPPADWSTVLDVIALPDDPVLERGRLDEETGRRFTKFGLVIRADEALTVRMAATSPPDAVMGWGVGSGAPVPSIRIDGCSGRCPSGHQPACPFGDSADWVVYPGGIWTQEPACVEMAIEVGDDKAVTRLPIGIECS